MLPRVTFEDFVGRGNAQLSGFREVEAALARVFHIDLGHAPVVERFGEEGIQFDGSRKIFEGLGEFA